jgi:hypothetical protein
LRGGLWLIPADSVISDDGDPLTIPLRDVPTPLPLNSVSLDADALAMMKQWYGSERHHRFLVGPDVGKPQTAMAPQKRSAVKG